MRIEIVQRHHMVDLNRLRGALATLEGDGGTGIGVVKRARPHGGIRAHGCTLPDPLITTLDAIGAGVVRIGQVPGQNLVPSVTAITVHVLPGLTEPARARSAFTPGNCGRRIRRKRIQGL